MVIRIDGESSRLSTTLDGSWVNAAFGEVSATGVGDPEFEVTHNGVGGVGVGVGVIVGVGLGVTWVAVQPAGRFGAVTPSKFSWNIGVDCGIAVGSRAEFASPLAVTLLWRNEVSSRIVSGVTLLISARPAGSKWAVNSSNETSAIGSHLILIFIRPREIVDWRYR